jgi:hypothetical protein
MASSKCPVCTSTSFEGVLQSKVPGYNFKLNFIQCSRCGVVVGVMPFHDPSAVGEQIRKEISDLSSKVTHLELLLDRLDRQK